MVGWQLTLLDSRFLLAGGCSFGLVGVSFVYLSLPFDHTFMAAMTGEWSVFMCAVLFDSATVTELLHYLGMIM